MTSQSVPTAQTNAFSPTETAPSPTVVQNSLAENCSQSTVNSSDPPPTVNFESLQRLSTLLRSLTPKDVGFDSRWVSTANVYAAPVAYVHITENEIFSMGIFILRPGSRIPLHDHPGMYGVLRVIYGSLRCRSFSRLQQSSKPVVHSSFSNWQFSDVIMARPYQDVVLTPESPTQILGPVDGNLHEITPINGSAVFLDILAPPYDHDLGTRECRFYKEINMPHPNHRPLSVRPEQAHQSPLNNTDSEDALSEEFDSSDTTSSIVDEDERREPIIYLVETNQPKDYWCESAEYLGPSVL